MGSSCKNFETSPSSVVGTDLYSYLVVAWTMHLDLIPTEVGCVVMELEGPSVVGQHLFFLQPSEIIHSKMGMLQF
jgi:hypothetical protein